MILFLNGSLGVGKTSVSKYLLWCHPQTVLLEGDALGNTNPFDPYDKVRIQNLIDIIRYMILKYQGSGYTTFVVDTIFEKEHEIQGMNEALKGVDAEVYHYLLVCDQVQRERQIVTRNRDNHEWEIGRSAELQDLLLQELATSNAITIIETSGRTVAEVGEAILNESKTRTRLEIPANPPP